MIFGAYQSSRHLSDLAVMLGLGWLGWEMKRLGWARPPFLIAFVLSNPTERYLWISVNRYGLSWLTRPGALIPPLASGSEPHARQAEVPMRPTPGWGT